MGLPNPQTSWGLPGPFPQSRRLATRKCFGFHILAIIHADDAAHLLACDSRIGTNRLI